MRDVEHLVDHEAFWDDYAQSQYNNYAAASNASAAALKKVEHDDDEVCRFALVRPSPPPRL